ncbi:MAG: 23S rRNA (adenine(2030)-N(6))-methyltransferase RlmJ, partial [Hyphomicrobium sp.]
MNYHHDYHAGNFADVLKHIILARVVTYMKQKPKPFRVIDTHAGAGLYDLESAEAAKTAEWRDGIGRIFDADLPQDVAKLVEPYLDAVRAVNSAGLRYYPGSPLIARHLMRHDDVLVANELG